MALFVEAPLYDKSFQFGVSDPRPRPGSWYLPQGALEALASIEGGDGLGVEATTVAILDEKALEEKLVRDWPRTAFANLGLELVTPERHGRPGRQVLTRVNAIDLLGYRRDRREWWVIELKHGRPCHAGRDGHGCDRRTGRGPEAPYAVRGNDRLTLWTWDDELTVSRVEGEP